jgi:peptide deformylase
LSKAKSASGGKRGVQLEGCLSLKDIWGIVKRHQSISVSFMNEKGEKHTKTFDGFLATIIQHEYDHLQGVLFPKRVLEQKQQLYHSKKNTKGETEFEEMTL